MSIKPVAMIPENELKHIEDRRTALVVPVCEEWSDRACVMLYAIPATHRIVPVELLQSAAAEIVNPYIKKELQAIIEKEPT